MRIGLNPDKDKEIPETNFFHQVVIPVYIPTQEGYFRDGKRILSICIDSVVSTSHRKTYITAVNNGSCPEIIKFLEVQKEEGKIQEVINTDPVGKLNAIVKGIAGHDFPLITITDSDVLFKPGWQKATAAIFSAFPKTGTVGLIPQYNMFSNFCTNVLFDTFFDKNTQFIKVSEPGEMRKFYQSLGWEMAEDHPYLDYAPAIKGKNTTMAYIGSSHVVATYRRELFEKLPRFFRFRMGGDSERYLDRLAQEKDLWKLTTLSSFAYHMGNSWEEWMEPSEKINVAVPEIKPLKLPLNYRGKNMIKNRIFKNILRVHRINQLFFRYKNLPKNKLSNYPKIFY